MRLSRSGHTSRMISIHALREEGDCEGSNPFRATRAFLSTPSARRATGLACQCPGQRWISIHALREEGDHQSLKKSAPVNGFLSTPSARRATYPA